MKRKSMPTKISARERRKSPWERLRESEVEDEARPSGLEAPGLDSTIQMRMQRLATAQLAAEFNQESDEAFHLAKSQVHREIAAITACLTSTQSQIDQFMSAMTEAESKISRIDMDRKARKAALIGKAILLCQMSSYNRKLIGTQIPSAR